MRVIAVLSVAAFLLEGIHLFSGRSDRLREIYGGALQIAHPEYRVTLARETDSGPISTDLQMSAQEVEPSLGARTIFGQIQMNVLGLVSAPSLPRTRMSELLASFGGGRGTDEILKSKARQEISELPEGKFASAIVELADPMTEDELTSNGQTSGIRSDAVYLFLSGKRPNADLPLYWRPCAVYEEECIRTPAVQLFRHWTANLNWADAVNLHNYDLDISELRQAAERGLVYGFLAYGYSGKALAEIVDQPTVRTVRIVAIS
ncbi:hypothetical protein [Nonomuraea wenchangensis]|uniref:hypothetical protein n=1 Tax=Nonomuraea wenchangensis TaxID=568860 RepID=UPI001160C1B8|nr:hypothetical protein [Nonomuraea wenchangensis]